MFLNITISPSTITIGQPVTVTYDSEGYQNTTVQMDNLINPISFGGDSSGSFKTIPLVSGTFNASITGSGRANFDSTDTAQDVVATFCTVN
jgi:hypothetical protein